MKLSRNNSRLYLFSVLILLFAAEANALDVKSVNFNSVPVIQGDKAKPQSLEGVLTKPIGKGPFPAVVLLHTCGGPGETTTKFWPGCGETTTTLGPMVVSPQPAEFCGLT